MAGPSLTGVLAATVGALVGLVLDAASFLVSALCLAAIGHREPEPSEASPEASPGTDGASRAGLAAEIGWNDVGA